LTEVSGAGHFSPMESPEIVTAALREFWESVG
jgi:pimeloyl-ACP methyl ester carboxylesterase